jgi:hypothetical protein
MSPNEFGGERNSLKLTLGKSQSIQHEKEDMETQQSPMTLKSHTQSIP